MNLPSLFSGIQWSGRGHDVTAIVAAVTATISANAVSQWLTIIFLLLGIIMRVKKITEEKDD